MKRRGYIYCYMDVDGPRNPYIIALEDRLIHLAASYQDDVVGMASDYFGSNRSGLDKMKKALTEAHINVVYIQDVAQFGNNEKFRECQGLMIEKGVEIVTPKDKYQPEDLLPKEKGGKQ